MTFYAINRAGIETIRGVFLKNNYVHNLFRRYQSSSMELTTIVS